MKKWISIVGIMLLVVFAAGCTSSTKNYNSNGVSFDYPAELNSNFNYKSDVIGNYSSEEVTAVLGGDNGFIFVTNFNMSDDNPNDKLTPLLWNFEAYTYDVTRDGNFTSNKTRTVAGYKAIEFTKTVDEYTFSRTFIAKNKTLFYNINIFITNKENATVDLVLDSFKFT